MIPTLLLPQASNLVKELDAGDGVLILTDMYGGTPSNIAAKLVVPGKVEGVAGVSLPMLIRVLTYRDRDAANDSDQGGQRRVRRRAAHAGADRS